MEFIREHWNKEGYNELIHYLNEESELEFAKFQKKLIPTNYKIHGIRTPILRQICKNISKGNSKEFLNQVEFNSFEEVLLFGMVMCNEKDEIQFFKYLNTYISKIDNWATNDLIAGAVPFIHNNESKHMSYFLNLIKTNKPYYIRFSLIVFLKYYKKEECLEMIYNLCENIKNDDYYVKMAKAWLICELYIKFPCQTKTFLQNCNLDKFTKNKSIQKITESFRVSMEDKIFLRTLKIK